MLTRKQPSPYNPNDPFTMENNQGQLPLPTSRTHLSKRLKVDPPSKFNSNVTAQLDSCILKMIRIDPRKRQNSVWDLITDLDMLR